MEVVYVIWIYRKDGVLEQMTDEEGMPTEMPTLPTARARALEIARESHVDKVFIRETRTVETHAGKVR